MHTEITSQEAALDKIFSKVDKLFSQIAQTEKITGKDDPLFDVEMRAELVKHLCVRVSAYLEQSIKIIISKYADTKRTHAATLVDYFLNTEFPSNKGRNPRMDYIWPLLAKLDNSKLWSTNLKSKIGGGTGRIAGSIDSIVENRNKIAHTGELTVNMTLREIQLYYSDAKMMVQHLYDVCK